MQKWGQEKGEFFIERQNRASFFAKAKQYGTSVIGTPLFVYLPKKWSTNRTLILAGIHGEEADTTNLLSYSLRSVKPEFLKCAVILCANPDGMQAATRSNNREVDLNRNFPTKNWSAEPTFHRWDTLTPRDTKLSPGKQPASEPEIFTLIKLIDSLKIRQIVSIHSPLGCVNYEQPEPWELANVLTEKLKLPLKNDIGYPCPGSMGTWAAENDLKIITLELPSDLSLTKIRYNFGPVIQELLLGNLAGL